jgi:hypothetical protein
VVLIGDPHYKKFLTGNWESLEELTNSYTNESKMGIPKVI